jgi:iron-sulfur cluster insertion protein
MALPGEGEGGGVTAELVFYYMLLYLNIQTTQSEIKIMTPVEITTSPLLFSDAAATKVRELIAEEGDERLMLRVFISGGGCSGFQYGFTFEESLGEEDTVVENQGVKLLIDPMSYQYLTGAEIDYTEGLEGAQFVIRNPNATTTCGCGSSFSV